MSKLPYLRMFFVFLAALVAGVILDQVFGLGMFARAFIIFLSVWIIARVFPQWFDPSNNG